MRQVTDRTDRATGPAWPIDDAWRKLITARMDELEITRAELARLAGVSRQTIQAVFLPASMQSRLVPAIHKALRLPPPAMPSTSKAEIIEGWSEITEDQKELVRQLIRSLRQKPLNK